MFTTCSCHILFYLHALLYVCMSVFTSLLLLLLIYISAIFYFKKVMWPFREKIKNQKFLLALPFSCNYNTYSPLNASLPLICQSLVYCKHYSASGNFAPGLHFRNGKQRCKFAEDRNKKEILKLECSKQHKAISKLGSRNS